MNDVSPAEGTTSPIVRSSFASPVIRTNTAAHDTLPQPASSSRLNGVFGFEDNEDEATYRKGRKLKPFEITEEVF